MTGIIATLGPKTSNKEMITDLHQAGVDIFRLNFAHETIQS
jgi:pyruvate kinase